MFWPMPMMLINHKAMRMLNGMMMMRVYVRLYPIPIIVMSVLMVLIVIMRMQVIHFRVVMLQAHRIISRP